MALPPVADTAAPTLTDGALCPAPASPPAAVALPPLPAVASPLLTDAPTLGAAALWEADGTLTATDTGATATDTPALRTLAVALTPVGALPSCPPLAVALLALADTLTPDEDGAGEGEAVVLVGTRMATETGPAATDAPAPGPVLPIAGATGAEVAPDMRSDPGDPAATAAPGNANPAAIMQPIPMSRGRLRIQRPELLLLKAHSWRMSLNSCANQKNLRKSGDAACKTDLVVETKEVVGCRTSTTSQVQCTRGFPAESGTLQGALSCRIAGIVRLGRSARTPLPAHRVEVFSYLAEVQVMVDDFPSDYDCLPHSVSQRMPVLLR